MRHEALLTPVSAVVSFLCAFLLLVPPLEAQQLRRFEPVDSGKVIRFEAGGVILKGRLLTPLSSRVDSALYCRIPGPPCVRPIEPWQLGTVRPTALDALEVQVGTNAAKGARIGAVVGALLTLGGYGLGQGFCEYQCLSDTDILIRALPIGALWGGAVGALFGSGSARMERRF